MKTKPLTTGQNGHKAAENLIAKAATLQRLADSARKHLKLVKAEHKQARKAFKQAKKAAKRARREASAAAKKSRSKGSARTNRQKPTAARARRAKPAKSRLNDGTAIFLEQKPAQVAESVATA